MFLAMTAGSNWWINTVARFPGTRIINPLKMGTLREYDRRSDPLDQSSDLVDPVNADNNDQENDLGTHGQEPDSTYSSVERVARNNNALAVEVSGVGIPLDAVPVTMTHLGTVKSELHPHQSIRSANFHDQQEKSIVAPAGNLFNSDFAADLFNNPTAAIASFNTSPDRKNFLELLAS